MPAFTFEKISPPIRRGPIPPIVKKQKGLLVQILGRFVEARVKRAQRKNIPEQRLAATFSTPGTSSSIPDCRLGERVGLSTRRQSPDRNRRLLPSGSRDFSDPAGKSEQHALGSGGQVAG